MKLRVKDLITPPSYVLPALTAASPESQAERIYCDGPLRALLRRVLDNLMPGPDVRPPATLLLGEAHSGKTRLLRLVRALLRDPSGPLADKLFPAPEGLSASSRVWVVLNLTYDDAQVENLAGRLEQLIVEAAPSYGITLPSGAGGDLAGLLSALPDQVSVVVTIDDLDAMLNRPDVVARRLCAFITQLSQPPGLPRLSLLLALRLESLPTESRGIEEDQACLGQLLRACDVIHTDCTSIVNAALSHLVPKTAYQQREVAWLLRYFKRCLPALDCEEHEFIRDYPLHPAALRVAQQLWRYLPQFNLSDFILGCVRAAYPRPAAAVFTVDDLFGLLEPALRGASPLQSLFEVYDQVVRRAVERLHPEWRTWGTKLARALAVHTIAELPATARELAEGCLLYGLAEEPGGESVTALLLDQMQRLAPEHIQGDGAPEPRFTLTRQRYRSIGERLLAESRELGDAAPQLFTLLFACGETYFHNWPLKFYTGSADYHLAGTETEWQVEELPGVIRLNGEFASGEPLRVVILGWAAQGKAVPVCATDFVWRVARPSANELRTLKAFAVLREWERAQSPPSRSPQFARLMADHRGRADQIFARLFLFDGHLSHNARPVSIDCEPPLSLMALLQRHIGPPRRRASDRMMAEPPTAAPPKDGGVRNQQAISSPVAQAPSHLAPGHTGARPEEASKDEALWLQPLRYALDGEGLSEPRRGGWAALLKHWGEEWSAVDLSAATSALEQAEAGHELAHELLKSKAKLDALAAAAGREADGPGSPRSREVARDLFDHSPLIFKASLAHGLKLRAFNDWLPQLASMRAYLGEAEVGQGHELYPLWQELTEASRATLELLSADRRARLSALFEGYRRAYSQLYLALHQQLSSAHTDARLERLESSLEWDKLERLSRATGLGTEHFAAARRITFEIAALRCDLSPHQALLYRPRCRCGFAASDAHRLDALGSRAMGLLREGLAHSHQQLPPLIAHLLDGGGELEAEVRAELLHLCHGGDSDISDKTLVALSQALAAVASLDASQTVSR